MKRKFLPMTMLLLAISMLVAACGSKTEETASNSGESDRMQNQSFLAL